MNHEDRTALRGGVALCVHPEDGAAHVAVRVEGEDAWDALDRLLPCHLALRDGQGRHTMFVEPDGSAGADVIVVADPHGFWLLVDGLTRAEVIERVRAQGGHAIDPGVTRVELAGPFAWELAAKVVGQAVVGLPYMELKEGPIPCLRAGRTGEYGYEFLVPHGDAAALRAQIVEQGAALDVREVPAAALNHAALENAFYVPHTPGLAGLDPLELQLQWRLAWDKEWPGVDVLRTRKAQGTARRVVGFRGTPASDAAVHLGSTRVGEIRVVREGFGYALIDAAWAHPGVPGLTAGEAPITLVSPPFVENLSLFVKPQRHRYAHRHEVRPS